MRTTDKLLLGALAGAGLAWGLGLGSAPSVGSN
jgi:hypothetical protein